MMMQPLPSSQGVSRPFVVGLVMLLLFVSMQADWGAVKQPSSGRRADLRQIGLAASPNAAEMPSIREKIIYDLSTSNDRLERENWQMKQHILDLRRAMRKEGCTLNGTLFTFPDLEKWLLAANDTAHQYFDRHRPRHHSALQRDAITEQRQSQDLPEEVVQNDISAHRLRGGERSRQEEPP